MHTRLLSIALLLSLWAAAHPAILAADDAQPPGGDPIPKAPGAAQELADGAVPPLDAEGDFIIGPTHKPAAEMSVHEGVPQGTIHNLSMNSADSKIYPGIARDPNTFGTVDTNDPAKLVVTSSHPAPYTRKVAVYVPKQYVPGTAAPFIVGADGPDPLLFTALDNLIAQGRVPAMIAISIGNGGGDAQGSQRGLEYDTMSGKYAQFVETEVLPLVERQCQVKLTDDPDGRATMGCSSGGSCALIMAWYRPDLYHRVLTYSGTYVNQQWPSSADTPHGAWEFHERLIPNSPAKPLRIWLEVSDRDLVNPNVMRDNMHDWPLANKNMAKALAAKGYHYQFVLARNAVHCDGGAKQQTLPEALEWLWQGTLAAGEKAAPQTPPAKSDAILSGSATLPSGDAAVERAAKEMAEAALNFWASLTPELQAKCAFPFDNDERFNWHFIPRERKGITWNDMTPAQQALAHAFLASGLSNRGYQQAQTIISLEQVLKELEQGRGPLRDSGNYAFSVFGTPGEHATWGWRFEGHHLSLTFTIVAGRAVAGPVFFGTNPATVLEGPRKGLRVLAVEEDLGRELVKSLTPEQRKIAIYDAKAPNEIITGNSRKADPGKPVGLAVGDMTAPQQMLLMTLVENYAYRLRPELADQDLAKIAAAGFKEIHFAWAGDVEPGRPHYYRLHGPTFLVEFDNTQNEANHIHTVWRDSANDFGEDLLRLHYEQHKHDPHHGHDG